MRYRPDMVYFILNPYFDVIKIGRTKDIATRIVQIRTDTRHDCRVCGVFQNLTHEEAINLENRLHYKFRQYRCWGEWFKRKPIEQYILSTKEICFPKPPYFTKFLYDLKLNEVVI